jgi:hypothetical protein
MRISVISPPWRSVACVPRRMLLMVLRAFWPTVVALMMMSALSSLPKRWSSLAGRNGLSQRFVPEIGFQTPV